MKRFSVLTKLTALTLIVSACGARAASQATPTISPVDLQSTMAAAALRIAAETQAAIPTSTPLPPTATLTNTPDATATLPVMPTLGATFTAVPGGNSVPQDPCITTVLPAELNGENIRIRIDNPTRATINVTVYLLQANPNAVCGYRAYTVAPAGSLVINDLVVGCYTLWAWNPDPNDYFMVTNGTSCLDTSNTWAFDISTSTIRLRP
jgi:hypothetical protein